MATVRFEDGTVAHFDVKNPSPDDISDAHEAALQQRFKNAPIRSLTAKIGFPLAGGLGLSLAAGAPTAEAGAEIGGALGTLVAPGPGTAIGTFAGGALGETVPFFLGMLGGQRTQQRLAAATTGLPLEPFASPQELVKDFGSALAFVSGAKGAGAALELAPAVVKALPVLKQFTQPGTVLHSVATNAAGGLLSGGFRGAGVAAVLGGGFQGVTNFATALKGFPLLREAVNRKLGQQIEELSSRKSQLQQVMEQDLVAAEKQLENRLGVIQQTETELTATRQTQAHQLAKSFRRGGTLHESVNEYRAEGARAAWEPVDQLGREISDPISFNEMDQFATQRFGADPGRKALSLETIRKSIREEQSKSLKGIAMRVGPHRVISDSEKQSFIQAIAKLPPEMQSAALQEFVASAPSLQTVPDTFTASQLLDASRGLGQEIRLAIRKGTTRVLGSDLPEIDARTIIADTLEAHAPVHLKGAFAQGKAQWQDYATDNETLTHYFAPSASPNASTENALGLLEQLSEGTASPHLQEFATRLEQGMKTSLTRGINPLTQELQALPLARQAEKQLSESAKQAIQVKVQEKVKALGFSAKSARTVARLQLDILSQRSRRASYFGRLLERAAFWGIFVGGIRSMIREASK